jgi:hypothetical protein
MSHDYWQWQWQRNRILTPRRKGAKGSHDLSRLESGERNLVKPKAREGRVSGRERVHFTNWHELKHAEGVTEISPVLVRQHLRREIVPPNNSFSASDGEKVAEGRMRCPPNEERAGVRCFLTQN